MSDCFTIDQQKALLHLCDDVQKIIESKLTKHTSTAPATGENSEYSSQKAVNETFDSSDVVDLDEQEIILLADFIISWNVKRCECLLRQHLDKLPYLIQQYLVNVTSVITSLWKQIVELNEPQTNKEV